MAATRLPGKPLADIHGTPMIVHVWRRAIEAEIGRVAVATDDEGIAAAVRAAGGEAVMTGSDHLNGTSRINEALALARSGRRHRQIVNVQGDLPDHCARHRPRRSRPLADPAVDIATLAAEIVRDDERTNPTVVKVVGTPVAEPRLRALYFTRATAPWGEGPLYHHIGLYAYRRAALARYVDSPPLAPEIRRGSSTTPWARWRTRSRSSCGRWAWRSRWACSRARARSAPVPSGAGVVRQR